MIQPHHSNHVYAKTVVGILFVLLSITLTTICALRLQPEATILTYLWGGTVGSALGLMLIFIDKMFKRINLRTFNLVTLGLFFGFFMAQALLLIVNTILDLSGLQFKPAIISLIKNFTFLFFTYLGVVMTLRFSDQISLSLPFITFSKQSRELLSEAQLQKGELLKIKIQRHGKEELQGIGYLDDGTMVVVNGGGSFIGEMIPTRVLSVKTSGSGRMIFCNVAENENTCYDEAALV